MAQPEYSVEQLSAHNVDDLYLLYESVYGRQRQPGYYHKKYDTTYTGHSYVCYLAYNSDRMPIAFFGIIPCYLRRGNDRILAAQTMDAMTDPGYRGQGIYKELIEHSFRLCRQQGIRLLFSFPNQNSGPGLLKSGGVQFGNLEYFSLQTRKFSWEDACAKFRCSAALYQWYCSRVLRKYSIPENGLPNELIAEGFTGVDRDKAYLEYRTYNTTRVLLIGRSKVWVKIKNGLAVGDISLEQDSDFEALIDSLLMLCRKLGLKGLSFQTSSGTRLHRQFVSRYTSNPSFPIIFHDFGLDYPLDNIKFTFADVDIF